MIDINLLPRARRHANDRRRAVRRWIAFGGIWCALLAIGQAIAVSSEANADLSPLEREIDLLGEESKRLDAELATSAQAIARADQRLAAARAVIDHPDWSALLARVVEARPADLIFRRWSLDGAPPASVTLRLEGTVPTLGALTDFALRLEKLEVFRRVTILSAQAAQATPSGPVPAAEEGGARTIGFAIEAELISAMPPAEREEAK
jgi:Tfp pilus assembly protein PilN